MNGSSRNDSVCGLIFGKVMIWMEKEQFTPLNWSELACDTLMKKYRAEELPPAGHFHYHQGVFLLGMQRCWEQNHKEKYFHYSKAWIDSLIKPDGTISNFNPGQLDDIQPGILLYRLFDQTGERRYQKALHTLISIYKAFPRNSLGGLWHKRQLPNQMWLDGLFMGGPLAAEYAAKFNCPELFDMVVLQAELMAEHCQDPRTGLLRHGWDESRKAEWADPKTGCAPECWGRAVGWYVAAVMDILDYLPKNHQGYYKLTKIFKKLIRAILRYQDESDGRWYQVVDKGNLPGNWLENSCSCLFVYAISKAVRKGLLDKSFLENARKGYKGVLRSLNFDENGGVKIGNVCIGTGIGDYDYYIRRPTSVNDLHGVGTFLMMCDEMNRIEKG